MTYTPDIPVIGDSLGGTRDRIRENFQVIKTYEAVNHVGIGETGAGKHKFLQMPETNLQTPSTPPATSANEGALYTRLGTNPAETNLWFRAESSGFTYQLTRVDSSKTGSFRTSTGWTFLPGNMIMQWGTAPGSSSSSIPVVFPYTFSTGVYNIQITPLHSSSSPGSDFGVVVVSGSANVTGFSIGNIGGHTMTGWYWTAIGI